MSDGFTSIGAGKLRRSDQLVVHDVRQVVSGSLAGMDMVDEWHDSTSCFAAATGPDHADRLPAAELSVAAGRLQASEQEKSHDHEL
jgi:hypothetical protein